MLGNALRIYDVAMQAEYKSIVIFYTLIVLRFILYCVFALIKSNTCAFNKCMSAFTYNK